MDQEVVEAILREVATQHAVAIIQDHVVHHHKATLDEVAILPVAEAASIQQWAALHLQDMDLNPTTTPHPTSAKTPSHPPSTLNPKHMAPELCLLVGTTAAATNLLSAEWDHRLLHLRCHLCPPAYPAPLLESMSLRAQIGINHHRLNNLLAVVYHTLILHLDLNHTPVHGSILVEVMFITKM
jgi:hypothetical protein